MATAEAETSWVPTGTAPHETSPLAQAWLYGMPQAPSEDLTCTRAGSGEWIVPGNNTTLPCAAGLGQCETLHLLGAPRPLHPSQLQVVTKDISIFS